MGAFHDLTVNITMNYGIFSFWEIWSIKWPKIIVPVLYWQLLFSACESKKRWKYYESLAAQKSYDSSTGQKYDIRSFPNALISSKDNPASIYLLKVNNRNTRTSCEICTKLTIKIT